MYGKGLSDFPDRFDAFRDALSDLSDADVNAGFEHALRNLREFPVPADIREWAAHASRESRLRLAGGSHKKQWLLEDKTKDERFSESDVETRRQEFAEMVAAAARKLELE